MGSKASVLLQDSEIDIIKEETGFTANQIRRLFSRFTSLDKSSNGYLAREDLLRIPELAINPLGDRIVNAFLIDGDETDGINFRQFARTLARFRPLKAPKPRNPLDEEVGDANLPPDPAANINSKEEKLRFAFNIYDVDADGAISRGELLAVLHMMVGANISEDQLRAIADRTITEADQNGDDTISFEEFSKVMEKIDIGHRMSIKFLN